MSRLIVLIGDLVASRALADRGLVQQRLSAALADANARPSSIASPYTITLGDEFQAVLRRPDRVFRDAVAIQATLHPVQVRFSLAVGPLATPVNPDQALGMDGPAFHAARAGIDALKQRGGRYRIDILDPDVADLANAALGVIAHAMDKWQTRRFRVLSALQTNTPIAAIALQLGVSEQAVYKNISDGDLHDTLATFDAISRLMERALQAQEPADATQAQC